MSRHMHNTLRHENDTKVHPIEGERGRRRFRAASMDDKG